MEGGLFVKIQVKSLNKQMIFIDFNLNVTIVILFNCFYSVVKSVVLVSRNKYSMLQMHSLIFFFFKILNHGRGRCGRMVELTPANP